MLKKITKKYETMTIANKITLMYGGIFSLSLFVVSLFVIFNAAVIGQNNMKQEIIQSIENIESFLRQGNELTEEKLAELVENKYVEISVLNFTNKKEIKNIFGPQPPFIEKSHPRNEDFIKDRERYVDERGRGYTVEGEPGRQFMLIERPFHVNNNDYMIRGYKMIANNSYYIRSFGLRLLLLDILGIVCAFLIGKYISRIMLRPVATIRQTAEQISIMDLSQRIDVSGPEDEMRELSITFNSMIDRLESAFKKQTQFISDASHELRTPISVIQGYANLVNRWGKSDPVVLQESIDSILAETEHMGTLIKKLLFLAKSDQNNMHVQKEMLSLNQLVKEVIKEIHVMEINRVIKLEEKEEVTIFADTDLIKQLLWIHAENAMKYTKDGGTITFFVYKENEFGCVSVADDGPGIDKEDISLIFDRFYRADKSRNKEIPGTGLGLSIAKWIADVNDGKIAVESKKGKGAVFIDKFRISK